MSEKRRDQRGRILKTGESHRKDGLYMFRYTDTRKQRRYIYARSLEELRRKEAEIQRDLADGIDYAAGEMTVLELVTRYMALKRTLKENSYRAYDTVINRMRKDPFSQKQIRQIKPSDAKACTKKREGERSSVDGPERGRGTEGPQSGPVPGPRRREAARRAAAAA